MQQYGYYVYFEILFDGNVNPNVSLINSQSAGSDFLSALVRP